MGRFAESRGLRHIPEALLLNLFNSVDYAVVAVDPDGRVLTLNAAASSLWNIHPSQFIGRPITEALGTGQDAISELLQGALRRDKAATGREVVLVDELGRQVPHRCSASPLQNLEGKTLGAVFTLQPIRTAAPDEDSGGDVAAADEAFGGIVTGDPHMRKLFRILPTIARSNSSVLILGETGTGKSLLANAIHALSSRCRGPFVAVNCAALPETLLESELFGARAGAYTGATRDRPGRLAAANGGTLLVDEIGDAPLAVQVKLLRVLQERVYEPLGDVQPVPCDVRFITATHQDLSALVDRGAFRRDLYFRINVLKVELPPLRDRKGDIPLLVKRSLERLYKGRGKRVVGVSSRVLEILTQHDYPGNIRELENILEHAWVMCPDDIIEVEHLPEDLRRFHGALVVSPGTGAGLLDTAQAECIRQALERNHGHRGLTARELGMHRSTLSRKIRKLGLDPPEKDGRHGGPAGSRSGD